jgi:hypothetical protein
LFIGGDNNIPSPVESEQHLAFGALIKYKSVHPKHLNNCVVELNLVKKYWLELCCELSHLTHMVIRGGSLQLLIHQIIIKKDKS